MKRREPPTTPPDREDEEKNPRTSHRRHEIDPLDWPELDGPMVDDWFKAEPGDTIHPRKKDT